VTPGDFISAVLPHVQAALGSAFPEAHPLVVAHAALESGWGEAKAYREGRNLFNVTRTAKDPRPVVEAGDLEYQEDGAVKRIVQRFAAYGSIRESVEQYLRLLSRRYRVGLAELCAGDIRFIRSLGAAGYYTLPAHEYQLRYNRTLATVRAVLDKHAA
jgi:flagellum-specific peptidoglycan hydrolase FlgJ